MQRLLVVVFFALAPLPLAALVQVATHFDTTRTVRVTGLVSGFQSGSDRSYLYLDITDATGRALTWAIEGNALPMLIRAGWSPRVTPGQIVTVSAYPVRPEATASIQQVLQKADEHLADSIKAGRYLSGIDVTFPDGRTLVFGTKQ